MGATHLPNIVINIALDSAPVQVASFSATMGIVPKATNSLNGARVVVYTSVDGAQDDNTAGYIAAATLAAVTAMFSQSPKPASVKIGNVDLVGAETYATAIAAIRAVDDDWYGLWIAVRTNTEIEAVSLAVESLRKFFVCQSADASLLDSGLPAGLANIANRERTAIIYHDTATEWADAAYLANRLVWDPDIKSASWDAPIAGVAVYATALTDTQRTAAIANNVNVGLPYGSEDFFVDPGVNGKGRPIDEVLTADWLYVRLQVDVATQKVNFSARGEKWPMNIIGQGTFLSIIKARLSQGEQFGHFEVGQTDAQPVAITTSDRSSRKLRTTARGQFVGSARQFQYDITLGRDPVIVATS